MSNSNQVPDTSFKSVERLLKQMAFKGFMRLERAKIMGADLDCVFGVLSLAYVKALNGFDPSTGNKFSTYCVRTCWNEFNKYVEGLEREHSRIGHISIEDVVTKSNSSEDDDYVDPWDRLAVSDQETPLDRICRNETRANAQRCLSKETKAVVAHFTRPSRALLKAYRKHVESQPGFEHEDSAHPEPLDNPPLSFIGKYYKIDPAVMREVKKELGRVYGISQWNNGNSVPTYR